MQVNLLVRQPKRFPWKLLGLRLPHQDGRVSVAPVHRGEILGPRLLGKILHHCEISVKQLGEAL